ncbi:MAG: response regulator transcription factor [Bacteroidota bacterium]
MENNRLNVLLADPQPVVRIGLKTIFAQSNGFRIVGEAGTGAELAEIVPSTSADLLLMEIWYPDASGIQLIEQIARGYADMPILILSGEDAEENILRGLQAGAKGYVLKTTSPDRLLQAATAVGNGQSYFSPEVSSQLLNRIVQPTVPPTTSRKTGPSLITNREKEVLLPICEEYTNPEIAERLNISRRTVDTHRKNLLQKIGVRNTAGLIRFALREGIIVG